MPFPEEFLQHHWDSMHYRIANPVSELEFVQYLPYKRKEKPRIADFTKLVTAKTELGMCKALMQDGSHVFPNFKFVHSSAKQNEDVRAGLRPAIACYAKRGRPVSSDLADDWAAVEMFVYVGSKDERDPWEIGECPLDRKPRESDPKRWHLQYQSRRIQLAYAKMQLARQHRNFVFSLGFYGELVRIFRWDRTGGAVSRPSHISRNTSLSQYLQRFNALAPAARGWDTTLKLASDAERGLLCDAVKEYLDRVRADEVPMLPWIHETLDKRWPTWKVCLPGKAAAVDGRPCEIIIRRPVIEHNARGYFAYHKREKRLVFYKDDWVNKFPGSKNPMTEGVALGKLVTAEVPHLPNVLYASEPNWYFPRVTLTQDLPDYFDWRKPVALRMHIQIVEDIAYPINFLRNSRQLVMAVRNTLQTLQKAHDLGIVYRDISDNNIMLTADGEGSYLCDWGTACLRRERQPDRVGTQSFSPIELIWCPRGDQSARHDLESCFWMLVFMGAARFHPTRSPSANFLDTFKEKENEVGEPCYDGTRTGKQAKLTWLFADPDATPLEFACAPFTWIIRQLRALFAEYYHAHQERKAYYFEKLYNVTEMVRLCDEALAMDGWLEADASHFCIMRTPMLLAPEELEECVGDVTGLACDQPGDCDRFIIRPREARARPEGQADEDKDRSSEDAKNDKKASGTSSKRKRNAKEEPDEAEDEKEELAAKKPRAAAPDEVVDAAEGEGASRKGRMTRSRTKKAVETLRESVAEPASSPAKAKTQAKKQPARRVGKNTRKETPEEDKDAENAESEDPEEDAEIEDAEEDSEKEAAPEKKPAARRKARARKPVAKPQPRKTQRSRRTAKK